MRAGFLFRIRILTGAIVLISALILLRLYVVQVVNGDRYAALAETQYTRPANSIYDRGTVFFEEKEGRRVAAATVKSGYLLAITPAKITDREATFRQLSALVPLERSEFFMRVEKTDDPYEEIAHKVPSEAAQAIEALKLPGVSTYREHWRYYPGGMLAAQTVGFEGFAEDKRTGLYGLERYYNDTLTRQSKNLYANFFAEIFSNIGTTLFAKERARSGDVVTSIEPSVQSQLEKTLADIQEKYSSKYTGGIIINPKTGSVYALGVLPSFDPNDYGNAENPDVYRNPLIENVYEMGSIIKPITMGIGLDAGVVTPQTTYDDKGFLTLDGYTIRNYDGRGRGVVPMQEVLNQSLNTGVAYIASQVGTRKFGDYLKEFGLGTETGIDLPNETVGLTDNLDSPRAIEYATASYGQGIALTPIATVRALSALANGGVLVTPHVAKEIEYESGASKKVSFPEDGQVISKEASETLTRMLVGVVDTALMGGKAKMEHYSIAAKTGTAQIAKVAERGYYDDRYLHSFFGYFPAYDPQFLVFLYTIEPKNVQYASETLTAPFMDMAQFLISYYNVPPDR